jgi:hypothetical protein
MHTGIAFTNSLSSKRTVSPSATTAAVVARSTAAEGPLEQVGGRGPDRQEVHVQEATDLPACARRRQRLLGRVEGTVVQAVARLTFTTLATARKSTEGVVFQAIPRLDSTKGAGKELLETCPARSAASSSAAGARSAPRPARSRPGRTPAACPPARDTACSCDRRLSGRVLSSKGAHTLDTR